MPKINMTALAASAFMLAAVPALASVTIVNETDQDHTVTFDMGAEEMKFDVAPGAEASQSCPERCSVRFGGHDAFATDGDKLAIRDGETRPVKLTN